MGRRNRSEIEYEGAIYHIIARGIDGTDIFTNDFDRNKYMAFLHKMIKEYKILLFAFALMDNHVHLLIKTENANLSKAMQFLNSSYAHWFNYKHIRKGHLFQDRYKSYHINNPRYLLSAASYINLNPVEAGLVHSSEPDSYRWSSFFYCKSYNKIPSWLHIPELLQLCEMHFDEFMEYIKTNSLENKEKINVLLDKLSKSNQTTLPKNIIYLMEKIKNYFGDVQNNKKLRNLLIYIFVKEGYKIKEISELFQMSRQAVLKINNKVHADLSSEPLYLLWLNNLKICLSS